MGLITSPAFILMKAADRFANPTTAPNQLWQTDFTVSDTLGRSTTSAGSYASRQRSLARLQLRNDPSTASAGRLAKALRLTT
jgi:hypothetical protein